MSASSATSCSSDTSAYSSDAPYPTPPAPVSWKTERVQIYAALQRLASTVRYLESELDRLAR